MTEKKLELNTIDFPEIEIGYTETFTREVSKELVDQFAEVSGDFSPLHVDPEYAKTTELQHCQTHGALFSAFISALIGMRMPGKRALCVYTENQFRNPLSVGKSVVVKGTVVRKYDALRLIDIETEITDEDGTLILKGLAKVKVRAD